MYFPYQVSYLALRVRGRVAPGDVVLVHAAAGGVGSAAVQLAKAFGATVIATAGTDEKVEFCRSLGADYGVNYRSEDFVAFVDDVTNGRGVDVAFDTVGGAVTTETFRAMAFNGRHLIIGFASGIEDGGASAADPAQHLRELRPRGDLLRLRRLAPAGPPVRHELPVHRPGRRHLEPHPAPRPGRNDPPGDRPADRVRRGPGRARGARAAGDDRPHRGAGAVKVTTAVPLGEGVVRDGKGKRREPGHRIVPPQRLLDPVRDPPARRRADETIVVGAADDEQPRLAVDHRAVGVGEVASARLRRPLPR